LKIVNPVKTAAPQDAAQGKPPADVERPGPAIDRNPVEKTALLRKADKPGGCQQGDLVRSVMPAYRCRGP
jgi:hypothetical protein